jgi:hypothetical protein
MRWPLIVPVESLVLPLDVVELYRTVSANYCSAFVLFLRSKVWSKFSGGAGATALRSKTGGSVLARESSDGWSAPGNDRDDKEDHGDHGEEIPDLVRKPCDAAEAEQRGNQRDDKERDGVVKHLPLTSFSRG